MMSGLARCRAFSSLAISNSKCRTMLRGTPFSSFGPLNPVHGAFACAHCSNQHSCPRYHGYPNHLATTRHYTIALQRRCYLAYSMVRMELSHLDLPLAASLATQYRSLALGHRPAGFERWNSFQRHLPVCIEIMKVRRDRPRISEHKSCAEQRGTLRHSGHCVTQSALGISWILTSSRPVQLAETNAVGCCIPVCLVF